MIKIGSKVECAFEKEIRQGVIKSVCRRDILMRIPDGRWHIKFTDKPKRPTPISYGRPGCYRYTNQLREL